MISDWSPYEPIESNERESTLIDISNFLINSLEYNQNNRERILYERKTREGEYASGVFLMIIQSTGNVYRCSSVVASNPIYRV